MADNAENEQVENGNNVHVDFLNSLLHNPVRVKLNSGAVYTGM
jgi:small nuclear ribonucleoprotein (snRNP)-like protein